MKRFKLLFFTTALIFSTLLFAAGSEGGGGGSKEDAGAAALEDRVTETLVITIDDLKLQRIAMAKLYNLLPHGAEKDDAIASLDKHPRSWVGAREVSEEGFILRLSLYNNQLTGAIPTELIQGGVSVSR